MSCNGLQGTIDVSGLPVSLKVCHINHNSCTGTLDLTRLPTAMEEFLADSNKFTGTIDFTRLPCNIKQISLSANALEGTVDVSQLPSGIGRIDLHENLFSGTIPLIGFEPSYRSISLCSKEFGIQRNRFSGVLRYIGEFPPETRPRLSCRKNAFTLVDWTSMEGVKDLDASENALEGSLDVSAIPSSLTNVRLGKNKISGSLQIENIHENIQLIELQRNNFIGSIDLSRLPSSLGYFDVSENHLDGEIYFGVHIPAIISLQENKFTSIRTERSQGWVNVRRFDASDNEITQDTVKFGKLNQASEFQFINLCGNAIQVCKMANGQVAKSKKIFYDNGTEVQRKPIWW